MSSDCVLVGRVLDGDRQCFRSLVERYQDAAYGVALAKTGSFADAEDLAQETFHGTSFGLPGGCETYQTRSTVVTLEASASVPAGSFRRCLLVESSIATSREESRFHQAERERARDYFAGS